MFCFAGGGGVGRLAAYWGSMGYYVAIDTWFLLFYLCICILGLCFFMSIIMNLSSWSAYAQPCSTWALIASVHVTFTSSP